MRTPTPPSTLLLTAVTALAAATALSGCASPIPGSALPSAGGGAPSTSRSEAGAEAEPDPTGPRDRADACQVTMSGRGNIQVSGSGTRAVTRNDVTSLACGDGPLVEVDVQDGGISFTPEGGRAVRIDSGATAQVDGYEITVDQAAGGRAEFVVVPA